MNIRAFQSSFLTNEVAASLYCKHVMDDQNEQTNRQMWKMMWNFVRDDVALSGTMTRMDSLHAKIKKLVEFAFITRYI